MDAKDEPECPVPGVVNVTGSFFYCPCVPYIFVLVDTERMAEPTSSISSVSHSVAIFSQLLFSLQL